MPGLLLLSVNMGMWAEGRTEPQNMGRVLMFQCFGVKNNLKSVTHSIYPMGSVAKVSTLCRGWGSEGSHLGMLQHSTLPWY